MQCRNRLTVIGTEPDLIRFQENIMVDNEFDFSKIIGYNSWGTEENATKTTIQHIGGYLIIDFTTAWCPYSRFFQIVMCDLYPTLMFTLLYIQRAFCGYYKCAFNFRSFHKEELQIVKMCKKKRCDGFCRKCRGILHYFQREYQELFNQSRNNKC